MSNLTIYTGPMKCGKTKHLIEKYNECKNKGLSCIMFKPTMDTRFSKNQVVDRDGNVVDCTNIKRIEELIRYSFTFNNLFIDEFQFLNGNIYDLLYILDQNVNIYISGLNLTSNRTTFGLMDKVMCLANNINIYKANCDVCNKQNSAIYTYCTVNKKDEILIGDTQYISVCPHCYKDLCKKDTL